NPTTFGVGGGVVMVPGLVIVLRMRQRLAHGTSLGASFPIAISGVVGFAVAHQVDWPVGGLITVGAVAGAVLGARLLDRLPDRTLRIVFGAVLVATAARLLVATPHPSGRGSLDAWSALGLVVLG